MPSSAMNPVFCFGEVLIDFLNTGSQADGDLSLNNFTQFPGGAPANAAVAVAKLGGNAIFAGQVGDDPFGHFLIDALQTYGVDTTYTYVHPFAKTPLAFVFLDEHGERSFSFHRDHTSDVVFQKSQVQESWFSAQTIFHFCSNTLTESGIADVTQHIVSEARDKQALISFDVNLRHNLWAAGEANKAVVNNLVHQAHLVKFASEEIDYLSEGNWSDYLSGCFDAGVKAVLITDGGNTVSVHTAQSRLNIEPPKVQAVDTTGGGDAFIGAVLYGLGQQEDLFGCLSNIERLKPLIEFASHCGAYTVARKGAFPALPTFDDIKDAWEPA